MADKQKIRNYACELLKDSQNGFGSASYNILKMVIAYIDSLPEEPVSEDLKTELNKYIKGHFTIDTEQLDRFGIEEKDYMYSMDESDMLALVEHFTNWQKTKEKPVSEELEEAAKSHAVERYKATRDMVLAEKCKWSFKAGAEWQKQQDQSTIELAEDHAMLAGMEKMKEEMMANAIDVEVKVDAGGYPYIDRTIELYDYDKDVPIAKEGDKYKVVLIKEE